MRYSAEHTKETRARIVDAAGRLFRREGYGGSGIDGLTKAAGVTNGAFYGHFKSKREAFRTAMAAGLDELRQGIAAIKAGTRENWLRTFVDFYLGPKRTCDIGDSCALPNLSPDVMRADPETRALYEQQLLGIIDALSSNSQDGAADMAEDDAIALLSLLAGGVTLARTVSDPALSERIAQAVTRAAMMMTAADQSKQA
jgi:AcrR family transcriptional regulator